MPQWYKSMVKSMNKRLLEHQTAKNDDFPLFGRDKAVANKEAPVGKPTDSAKKPASDITMDWIKDQKQKLAQKSEDSSKDTHNVFHISSPIGEKGVSRAHANVSATDPKHAVSVAKENFPHLKDKKLKADIVSSTSHTPPNWPGSHHYELEQQYKMKKRD